MRIGLLLAVTAALLAGGCNLGDGESERETATRERLERKERELDRREREEARAEKERIKLDGVEFKPKLQPASSTAPGASTVDRAWFAGRWTDTDDCGDAGLWSPNGTFALADGTRGMWNVRDGKLVLQGTGGRSEIQLRRVDENIVEVVNADGSVGRSTRC